MQTQPAWKPNFIVIILTLIGTILFIGGSIALETTSCQEESNGRFNNCPDENRSELIQLEGRNSDNDFDIFRDSGNAIGIIMVIFAILATITSVTESRGVLAMGIAVFGFLAYNLLVIREDVNDINERYRIEYSLEILTWGVLFVGAGLIVLAGIAGLVMGMLAKRQPSPPYSSAMPNYGAYQGYGAQLQPTPYAGYQDYSTGQRPPYSGD